MPAVVRQAEDEVGPPEADGRVLDVEDFTGPAAGQQFQQPLGRALEQLLQRGIVAHRRERPGIVYHERWLLRPQY
jgi:hypothetical protein